MPDITMCIALICPSKEKCYRYKAIPSRWQSYFAQEPFKMDGCDYYWPLKEQNESGSGHRNGSISQEDPSGGN